MAKNIENREKYTLLKFTCEDCGIHIARYSKPNNKRVIEAGIRTDICGTCNKEVAVNKIK